MHSPSLFRARRACALVLVAACATSFTARASGFFYADLGARELGRGATGAAGTDDLSSIIYNPAGLADLTGLTVQLDVQFAHQPLSFTRDVGVVGAGCGVGGGACNTVSDGASYFPNTISGVALDLGVLSPVLRGVVVALAAHGPPAAGIHTFPDPRTFGSATEVAQSAPQRYSLIASNNFIFYPGVHIGWRATDWLSIGAGAEIRIFHITQTQSIFGIADLGGDYPAFDAVATIDAKQNAYPVFDGGLIVRPIPSMRNLSIGLSGHLGTPVSADGTMTIQTPPAAAALNIQVVGNRTHVDLRLPSDARLGVQWKGGRALVAVDGTWEGWGAVQNIKVTPIGISLVSGTGASQKSTPVAPIFLHKDFHGAFTARVGGEWRLFDKGDQLLPGGTEIALRLGGIYESSAIPDSSLQVDFVDGPRFAATAGLSVTTHDVSLTFAYAHYFQSERDVTTSAATRVDPYPAPPFIVGNGTYVTSLDAIAIDLRWHAF